MTVAWPLPSGTIESLSDGTGRYAVRVGGDRVWSFADRTTNFRLANMIDLVYHFDFNSATAPTHAQVKKRGGPICCK